MLKKILLYTLAISFGLAGINHFIQPAFYWPLIPPYFIYIKSINIAAGIAEIVAAILLIYKPTQHIGAYLVIILLILFIPTHIYMIQKNGCMGQLLCAPAWVAWVRLFPIQFIFIGWGWWVKK